MLATDFMTRSKSAYILGIAGGSCSGKTTFGVELKKLLGDDVAALIYQDSYYIDQSHKFKEDGGEVNFDHPSALDFELLARHLRSLKNMEAVEVPIYDFVRHKRKLETEHLKARPLIIVDGTLILNQPQVRELLDYSIFLEASEKIRFERRKKRDTQERGRELDGVIKQFTNHVKPMHDTYVEPSKTFASQIFSGEENKEIFYAHVKKVAQDLSSMLNSIK